MYAHGSKCTHIATYMCKSGHYVHTAHTYCHVCADKWFAPCIQICMCKLGTHLHTLSFILSEWIKAGYQLLTLLVQRQVMRTQNQIYMSTKTNAFHKKTEATFARVGLSLSLQCKWMLETVPLKILQSNCPSVYGVANKILIQGKWHYPFFGRCFPLYNIILPYSLPLCSLT